MKTFSCMMKTEMKLAIRKIEPVVFCIIFPILVFTFIVIIGGDNMKNIQSAFAGTLSISICATGLMGVSSTMSDYRHKKVLKKYLASPVSPFMLLIVQLLTQLLISLVSFVILLMVAKYMFNLHFEGSILLFSLYYLLVVASIDSIGMIIASVSPNIRVTNLLCTLIYFPMLFLSGAVIPYYIMPENLKSLINYLPLTHGIKLFENTITGTSTGNLYSILFLVLVFCISTLVSVFNFRWE